MTAIVNHSPSTPATGNIFDHPSADMGGEDITPLIQAENFRLERIVSNKCSNPKGFWYDQPDPEWILLITGTAILEFEQSGNIQLKAGDYMLIPAHARHRVEETSKDALCLALHYSK